MRDCRMVVGNLHGEALDTPSYRNMGIDDQNPAPIAVSRALDTRKRRQKSEHKGLAFTIIKLLSAGVVEQAKQTAARAIADLVGGAR